MEWKEVFKQVREQLQDVGGSLYNNRNLRPLTLLACADLTAYGTNSFVKEEFIPLHPSTSQILPDGVNLLHDVLFNVGYRDDGGLDSPITDNTSAYGRLAYWFQREYHPGNNDFAPTNENSLISTRIRIRDSRARPTDLPRLYQGINLEGQGPDVIKKAVSVFDRDDMDNADSEWRLPTETDAEVEQFSYKIESPARFDVYPYNTGTGFIKAIVAYTPGNDDIIPEKEVGIRPNYVGALVNMILYRVILQPFNNNPGNHNLALSFYNTALSQLGVNTMRNVVYTPEEEVTSNTHIQTNRQGQSVDIG